MKFIKDILTKIPPKGVEIVVSLRESNGERGLYPCIYMGEGVFKFLQNDEQYACEIQQEITAGEIIEKGVPKIKEKLAHPTIYLIGKPIIGWWVPKEKKGDIQNE